MHLSLQNLSTVQDKVNEIINKKQLKTEPKIIVVSKTFPLSKVMPLIESGHIHFGENKVQEAEDKWGEVKSNNSNLKLHMVGKLQTNKAKKALKLFDYIHSLDSRKLALKLDQCEKEINKKINYFVQVNLANEDKKSGISLKDLNDFYSYCTKELSLKVVGLMCLPPLDSNSEKYFKILKNSAEKLKLNELSMGMSSDFEQAISNNSTYLRLGTKILGERTST